MQPDTIIPELSNPQSWNRYSYVTNRPVNFNDPTGHRPCDDVDENGNCIDNEQRNKRLQKDLDKFVPPEKVGWDDMKKVGIGKRVQLLTPGEYDMFFLIKLRTHDGLDTLSLTKMYFILNNATDTTFELFSHVSKDGHNDPADAFRHAYWNALITRDLGADFAKQFTTAHETRPDSVREEAFMDLHNNQIGRDIALANPNATDAELQAAVLDSLYNGELYVWDGNNIYFSNQCPDCWWRAK